MVQTDKLARQIVFKSSWETYFIILLLADHGMVDDAFKACAYFRWVDDQIDTHLKSRKKRLSFLAKQKEIIDLSYKQIEAEVNAPEEQLIVDLIKNDRIPNSLLKSYINNFFLVLQFDAKRKWKKTTLKDLLWYSKTIGKAVTDCILHFIENKINYNFSPSIYKAAIAAHMIHMLRDFKEDIKTGFINIPKEYIYKNSINIKDVTDYQIKSWVKEIVVQAKSNFSEGKAYILHMKGFKRKIAAILYCHRFEPMLHAIEENDYILP
jgi:phytoene/squalene synthetase